MQLKHYERGSFLVTINALKNWRFWAGFHMGESPSVSSPLYYVKNKNSNNVCVWEKDRGSWKLSTTGVEVRNKYRKGLRNQYFPKANNMGGPPFYLFYFFFIFFYFFIFSTLHYISLALECNLGCVCFDFKSLPKIFFTKCACLVAHEK